MIVSAVPVADPCASWTHALEPRRRNRCRGRRWAAVRQPTVGAFVGDRRRHDCQQTVAQDVDTVAELVRATADAQWIRGIRQVDVLAAAAGAYPRRDRWQRAELVLERCQRVEAVVLRVHVDEQQAADATGGSAEIAAIRPLANEPAADRRLGCAGDFDTVVEPRVLAGGWALLALPAGAAAVRMGSSPSDIGSSRGEVEPRLEVDRCYLVAFRTGHPDAGALVGSGPKLVGGLSAGLLGFGVRPEGEGQPSAMLAVHQPYKGLIAWQLASSRHDFVAAAANE